MIVTCEACFTTFNLKDELVKPTGTKVQCSKCRKVFKVFPFAPEEDSPLPPPEPAAASADLSDSLPDFEIPELEASAASPAAVKQTELPPSDLIEITEIDFSELDNLLQEKDKKSPEPEQPAAPDLLDFSLDFPETKGPEVAGPLSETQPQVIEFPEPAEPALSEISLDDSLDFAMSPSLEMEEKAVETGEISKSGPLESDLDELEPSLEIDLSDLTLASASEPESAQDRAALDEKGESAEAPAGQKPRSETFGGLDEIESLDLSDIESLLERQEADALVSKAAPEGFKRAESVIIPVAKPSAAPVESLEIDHDFMTQLREADDKKPSLPAETAKEEEEHFLTFDELELDKVGAESAPIHEVTDAFQPRKSESDEPVPAPAPPVPPTGDDRRLKTAEKAAIEPEEEEEPEAAPNKGIRTPVMIVLVLAVIAGIAYGGYVLMNTMGISIPFMGQSTSNVSDPGNTHIKILNIDSRFVNNDHAGNLFIITGKAKNEYPADRGLIKVTGKIFTKDKAVAKTETVFCGNIISEDDLAHADAAAIQKHLQNRFGDNQANQKVAPGAMIPFMIVFSNLPQNLDEFSTEATASTALK